MKSTKIEKPKGKKTKCKEKETVPEIS